MNRPLPDALPVLSCDEVRRHEERLYGGDPEREWAAMMTAGAGVAGALLDDLSEIGGMPPNGKLLVLAGKGHNAGDALLAARVILARNPAATAAVLPVYGEGALRPLAARALARLREGAPTRVRLADADELWDGSDVCVDGIFGYSFRPPLDAPALAVLRRVNAATFRLRAAVDLPSGLDHPDAFRADFCYAAGALKRPLPDLPNAGRIRLIDLGWRFGSEIGGDRPWTLTPAALGSLARLRPAASDKRSHGHLAVVGGSRSLPGAALMAVLAALRSGVGLVTAFVPESLCAAFAAVAPEAMWVGWPETADGGLSLDGAHLLRERLSRFSAVLVGPGLGREPETHAWLEEFVRQAPLPLVLDADALQPGVVGVGTAPRILTPHAGEFARIAGGREARELARLWSAVLVLKGPLTAIEDGATRHLALAGGPVLARGGSGDLLAGIIGGLLAEDPSRVTGAAAAGVLWHGWAADLLARERGQRAVRVTDLLDYLGPALRHPALRELRGFA
jgi:ADP-dependent NAD(P)H-hydrate dehydratase / NAD(P)H-hydrate epimerase